MTTALSELPAVADPTVRRTERRRLPLIEQYLREQQELTAVERFAQRHADVGRPLREPYYRALLPATPPGEGQQYAFRVDLDACTGCKACVAACHSLNGLEEGEAWRTVGTLHGGTPAAPVQQTITSACHHCLDPACMKGCPVGAYEKDEHTGIVRHLDDQCIGCQYCTFTCPYDVPKYNTKRGIVRKCDMCSGRLEQGEAPACVQACPNGAIAIAVVDQRQVLEDLQGEAFVPGAPSPSLTAPTTAYTTERPLPRNLLPANFYTVRPAHEHKPLVVMLVLTQLSVGAFCTDAVGARLLPDAAAAALRPLHALVALAVGLIALTASVFHLGRPLYAFRAVLGLRTSWMSREIVAFGGFASLALLYAASFRAPFALFAFSDATRNDLSGAVAGAGIAGVVCSVFIYHVTGRTWWHVSRTGFKFAMTTVLLGLATAALSLSVCTAYLDPWDTPRIAPMAATIARLVVGAGIVKALGELAVLAHLRDRQYSDMKRTALLLTGDLSGYTTMRFGLLALGLFLSALLAIAPVSVAAAGASLIALLAGELIERTLFFAAMCSPAMPEGHR